MAWFSTISNKFPRLPGIAQEPEVALRAARHNNIVPSTTEYTNRVRLKMLKSARPFAER
jgi:hypothetical protein